MSEDGLRALEQQLGATAPPGIARLRPDQLRALAEAISDARHTQARELASATNQALDHIPRLLRAPVRKLFG